MKKILLVEDNEECRKALAHIIRHLGYEVIRTHKCLDNVATASTEQLNLIFISLDFSEMRGRDVIVSLRNNPQSSRIPILVYPPWDSEEATEAALNAGATQVLKDSFTLECFRQALHKHVPNDIGGFRSVHSLQ
jgi:CheY-like chemotaxis protein